MADHVRERNDTDPFPLRHAVRQRPLSEDELRAIYGGQEPARDRRDDRTPVFEPGVVRPGEWGRGELDSLAPPEPRPLNDAELEDDLRIPMRRNGLGLAFVIAVVVGAAGLLTYAVVDRTDALAALHLTQPQVTYIDSGSPVDRPSIELAPIPVRIEMGSAEPNRALLAQPAERPMAAVPRPVAGSRRPTQSTRTPAAAPYPELDRGDVLDSVRRDIDQKLGENGRPPAEQAAPNERNDVRGQEEEPAARPPDRAPSSDNPYSEPPSPAPAPKPDEIVRDPGF